MAKNSKTRTVTIETCTVGDHYGTCAVIRSVRGRRKLAETATVRPYGMSEAAYRDGEALAAKRGWTVVDGSEVA